VEHAVTDDRPIVDEGLGNSSYLRQADQRGLRIAWVAETHLHADFVSGARELARNGAKVLAPRAAKLAFPHQCLDDGDEVDLAGLTLQTLATPGHTPEHVSYLLLDGAAPAGVFTGGALLAASVARTDLIAPARPSRWPGPCTGRSTSASPANWPAGWPDGGLAGGRPARGPD
jgi:hydroxyacylglutathione hydrolase